MDKPIEYWLRGPVEGITGLLQPVAHALLQVQYEIDDLFQSNKVGNLWKKPNGIASVAFHLQHITGVIDRLFTYANGKELSSEQLLYLRNEGVYNPNIKLEDLVMNVNKQIDQAISLLKSIHPETLSEERLVGRKKLPSTQIGLLFHAAEHTTRHFGQLLVTVKLGS
ncbi:MAG: DinB family protein [Saprospiraceae bacterium]|nr:DinB family protein [Saprospiraceae bacterium]